MQGFLVRLLITAFAMWLASVIVPGMSFSGGWALFWAALLLGIVNALVRPLVVLLTLPLLAIFTPKLTQWHIHPVTPLAEAAE